MQIKGAKYAGGVLTLTMDRLVEPEAARFALEFKEGDYTISPKKKKRSLDANAYMWVLIDALAQAVNAERTEIYRRYIKEIGTFKDFHLSPDEAKTFTVAWERLGVGWQTEQVDYSPDGNELVIRAYYGSSTYSTKRMSKLIDLIVQDCQSVGVETRTPEEINSLLGEWDEAKNKGTGADK